MLMIKKGHLRCPEGQAMSPADQFYSLAFDFRRRMRYLGLLQPYRDRTLKRLSEIIYASDGLFAAQRQFGSA